MANAETKYAHITVGLFGDRIRSPKTSGCANQLWLAFLLARIGQRAIEDVAMHPLIAVVAFLLGAAFPKAYFTSRANRYKLSKPMMLCML